MQPPPEHDSGAPLVSIITPAFNSAAFVRHTLESVLAQTFTNFEMVVVDDGSTDETAAIVEAYSHRDPRIRLIRQSNQGIAAARNTAIASARGRLVALLDSDDVWFPAYLAEQVDILRRRPEIAVLSANAINLGGPLDGQPLLSWSRRSRLRKLSLVTLVRAEDSMSILALMRREVIDAVGAFDVTLRRSEDYDFWLRAAAAGFRIAVNTKPLGFYRRRPDSMSSNEILMLRAVENVLLKLRRCYGNHAHIQAIVDRQVALLAKRAMLSTARTALILGDRAQVAQQFTALAEATGLIRFRMVAWFSTHVPVTVWWAYRCKQRLHQLARSCASVRFRGLPETWHIAPPPNEPEQLNL